MTSITLRAADPTDATAIAAIDRPAVVAGTASFEIDPPDADEMARRRPHPARVSTTLEDCADHACTTDR